MIKALSRILKQDKERMNIPKSVQQVIPVKRIWLDGIWLVGNKYSKCWRFTDINYAIASKDDKTSMFLDYSELLNALDSNATTKITVCNKRMNKQAFEESILLPLQGDQYDGYRKEYNDMLLDKVTDVSNSIVQERYVTVSVAVKNIDEARSYFNRVGADLSSHLSQLSSFCEELDSVERFRIFHDFFRAGEEVSFSMNLKQMIRQGRSFRDYICPDTFEFSKDCFKMGKTYGRVLFLKDYASYIKDSLVAELAYEGKASMIDEQLDTTHTIDEIFRSAQRVFTAWSKQPPEIRTTASLLRMLDFDFFEVLDSVTIARSRKHIQKYYNTADIGSFPERLKPISERPCLTDLNDAINYNQIYELLMQLNLHIYTPTDYVFPSKLDKYVDTSKNVNQQGREQGIRRLMSINLLKRLESSVYAFKLTAERILSMINETIKAIDAYANGTAMIEVTDMPNLGDFDDDDQNTDFFSVGKTLKIDLKDMDYRTWRAELAKDADTLEMLALMISDITPEHDTKLQTLLSRIRQKIEQPINEGNRKILVFTAFSDTAEYLYKNVSKYVKANFGLDTAMVTGTVDGKTTIPKLRAALNTVLTCFSPVSKDKQLLMPNSKDEIDVLIATDCISEGQNLQDCDYCVNYDIHWNPVRIIQRFGRIDRIGSRNKVIQLVNFWPDLTLDDYINLKNRVEMRMKISVMASTGDDDLINADEKGDLEYRKAQLQRLQEEVVDIEDMSSGISIMDLGLNEFRLDLLEYIKHHPDIDRAPHGMSAVVPASVDAPAGVVFVLKNINGDVNINNQNRLHPFYMVYIAENGEVVCDHLSPKLMLDKMRYLCRGNTEPYMKLCEVFNRETKDGKNMSKYSELLSDAINTIIDVKEESDIDSLFKSGGTSALLTKITGLNDFELICFLVIK